jgi:hypothetical protein
MLFPPHGPHSELLKSENTDDLVVTGKEARECPFGEVRVRADRGRLDGV